MAVIVTFHGIEREIISEGLANIDFRGRSTRNENDFGHEL